MFYGQLISSDSERHRSFLPNVSREGLALYIDLSDERSYLLDDDDLTIAFSGRIYGVLAPSDFFEQLVAQYLKDRNAASFFDRIEGDFSLFFYDHRQKTAYLGRDRYARGDIYWRSSKHPEFFTHPGEYDRITGKKLRLNKAVLWDRFSIGAATPPETVFKEVFTPAAGELVQMEPSGNCRRISYWSPMACLQDGRVVKTDDEQALIDELRSCFIAHVAQEIAPFRVLGVGLSGGLDSAAIVGAARQNFDGKIIAVTVCPQGPFSKDLPRARATAEFNNARHIEYFPCARDLEDFPFLMGSLAQPFRSNHAFVNYRIAKLVAESQGECVLWGYGADLVLGNAGYCRRFHDALSGGRWSPLVTRPSISLLRNLPQTRPVVGLLNRLLWRDQTKRVSCAEKYFRVCKKPRYYQEKRLFRKAFLELGREGLILERIGSKLSDCDDGIVDRLIDVDFEIVHTYNQVSSTHQTTRLAGTDSIITYYNKDYAELSLSASDHIRALGGWDKYVLRQAFQPLVHEKIQAGGRGACVLNWDKMISDNFKKAVIRYLDGSEIVREIFRTEYLERLHRMIKHPGLMYLNLLGLALWYDVNFNGLASSTPLSTILDYNWRAVDDEY